MVRKTKNIINAVSTICFQGYFEQEIGGKGENRHNLDYWTDKCVNIENYVEESFDGDSCVVGSLNLSTKQIDDQWFIKIWDEYQEDYTNERNVIAYIPIDPSRLCWDMGDYCEMIEKLVE